MELAEVLAAENQETPGGRLNTAGREFTIRASGRFKTVAELRALPLWFKADGGKEDIIRLQDVARVLDTHEEERLKIRLNGQPGVKMTVQKQPQANTVGVVDAVREQLRWLRSERLLPEDVEVSVVNDQSVFVRHALRNAAVAVSLGTLLAMLVALGKNLELVVRRS